MSNLKLFEFKQSRSVCYEQEQEWYFSVPDVIEVLTNSVNLKQNINRILSRDEQLKTNGGTLCTLVEIDAADGKRRNVQASAAKGLLLIIQSIPSPKAESFKLWLPLAGSDRLDEIENTELAAKRTRELYKRKEVKIKKPVNLVNYKEILAKASCILYLLPRL